MARLSRVWSGYHEQGNPCAETIRSQSAMKTESTVSRRNGHRNSAGSMASFTGASRSSTGISLGGDEQCRWACESALGHTQCTASAADLEQRVERLDGGEQAGHVDVEQLIEVLGFPVRQEGDRLRSVYSPKGRCATAWGRCVMMGEAHGQERPGVCSKQAGRTSARVINLQCA